MTHTGGGRWPALYQLLRYGLVGLAVNFAGYVVYLLVTWLWLPPKTAITVLYPVGVAIGYFGHARYSFGYGGRTAGGIARFLIAHAVGYCANWTMLHVFSDRLGYPHQAVQATAVFVVAAILFLLFKFFVFPARPSA